MKTQLHNIKLLISITLLLLSTLAFAQQGINYQGVARDASNELLINTNITLDINIIKTFVNGETVYSENHTTTTDVNGIFSIVIGNGTPTLNLFNDITWSEDKHFLNVWLNGTEIGTTKFNTVPYAKSTETFGKWIAVNNGIEPKGTGRSVFIGRAAGLDDDLTNNRNIAIGEQSLQNNVTGNQNIALGTLSLNSKTEGNNNIAIGATALFENLIGRENIAIGHSAGRNNLGIRNVFIGNLAGNDEIGSNRLYINNDNASFPLIYGEFDNEVLGFNAKVGIGTKTPTVPLQITTGNDATLANGTGQLLIGDELDANLILDNNKIQARNNGVVSVLVIQPHGGNLSVGGVGTNAKVGIGTETPTVPLQITTGNDATLANGTGQLLIGEEQDANLVLDKNEIQARSGGVVSGLSIQPHGGNLSIGGVVSVQGSVVHDSDRRLKRNIANISYGLKDVLKLRPTEYFWKGKTQDHKSLGLIAQEVNEVIKNVVTYNKETDKYGVSYTELIPVLIKAIQEQEHTIQTLQSEVSELKASINNASN